MNSSCVAALEGQLRHILVCLSKNDTTPLLPLQKKTKNYRQIAALEGQLRHIFVCLSKNASPKTTHHPSCSSPKKKLFPGRVNTSKGKFAFPRPTLDRSDR